VAQGPFSDEVHGVLDAMLAYAERCARVPTGITDMWSTSASAAATSARRWWCRRWTPGPPQAHHLHFVSNVDGHDIVPPCCAAGRRGTRCSSSPARPSPRRRPWPTRGGGAWFLAPGRQADIGRHFVATTTNVEAAAAFGIHTTFGFWDWVGGRYSLWSAIGLPIAIAIGASTSARCWPARMRWTGTLPRRRWRQPAGAAGPAGRLVPQLPPLHQPQRGALPPGPARLPAYLQQLEMESNGKCVDLDGEPLPFGTSPVVWGEPGTNGQHAYFQMLHQGTDVIPVEFIAVQDRPAAPACRPAHTSCWPTAWRRARR
jgi:glucose-6-phosphate isomerase